MSQALLEAAGPTGAISVSFRIFPDHVEVDVLRSGPQFPSAPAIDALTSLLRSRESAGAAGPPHAAAELPATELRRQRPPRPAATGCRPRRSPNG